MSFSLTRKALELFKDDFTVEKGYNIFINIYCIHINLIYTIIGIS